ncbi:MAG: MFS transporter [Pseudomonadota bacterium]
MSVPSESRPFFKSIVLPLAVAETIIWASIFYSFPALLLQWERHTHWSKTELTGAFSLALLASALCAPAAGRLIDRGYARELFTSATVLGGVMLIVLSQVESLWQFYVVWCVIGAAMAGSLYEPCFAVLTRALKTDSKRGIAALTLIAGFAGTISFPLLNAFADAWGWRMALQVTALLMLLSAPVLVWRSVGAAENLSSTGAEQEKPDARMPSDVFRSTTFWLLGVSFAMIALSHGVLITHILPLLDDRGVQAETAVLAAAMIGPMQVLGRLLMVAVEGHVATKTVAQFSFIAMGIAALFLFAVTASAELLVIFVAVYGAAYGVTSITRPVVIAEFLGQENYGVIAGVLATLYLLVVAASPSIASLLWELAGYDSVITLAIIACAIGWVCLLLASKRAAAAQS